MAQRRMFSLNVVDTDRFLEMPPSAQLLYFQLGMHADDDGFVSSPKRITKTLRCRDKDLQMLVDRGWLISFDSGIVAITDWKLNNSIKADRYCETVHVREKNMLQLSDNKRYILMDPNWNQTGDILEPQNRIDKDKVDQDRIEKNNIDQYKSEQRRETEQNAPRQPVSAGKRSYGQFGWVQLSDREYAELSNDLGTEELERCIDYVDAFAQTTGNKRKWRDWKTVLQICCWEKWGKDLPKDVFQ